MPTPENTVRVFISSTFRDMHAERDHLVTVVFPELRERVEQLGLEFFDVDLRWGVPAKDASGETANSWEYCRQWIDRVEPFFVCILGQRYGWVPKVEDFKDDKDKERQASEARSITDLEIRHAVLDTKLKRRSYFYYRETPVPAPPQTPSEVYTEFVDTDEHAVTQFVKLRADINTCGRPVRGYACRWTGKAFTDLDKVAQDKQFGLRVLEDLWSGVLRDERYVPKEVWREVLNTDPKTDPLYTDESHPVPRELWEKIVALAKPPPKDPLDAEREQMEAFATSRLRWFQGRTRELRQLTDFIRSTDENAPRLAVMAAVPGQGKSALLAKLSTLIRQPSTFLITHFIGVTESSATTHALVNRLLGELDRSGIAWPADERKDGKEPKRDFNSLCDRLRKRLGDYAGELRIVILLDALNQLTDGHDLHWLPVHLGASVRVVVSCVEDAAAQADSPEQRVLQALASRQPAPLQVPLGPLTEDDVRTINVEYLKEYCKELDREHVDAICRMEQASNPLYLLVMLGELRTLGGNDMNRIVGERIAALPRDYPDTVALFRRVLQRLEVFGAEAVQWWCLYLAYGRVGMASNELADLLARKLGPDAAATALRIERGLRRYLLRRGGQLDFFHGQLRQAVMEQYGTRATAGAVHSDIATYFGEQVDPEKNKSWKGDKTRPFLQVAFHLVGAHRFDEVYQTLCDILFVEARCRLGQVFDLIADYRLAQENLPEAEENLHEKCARAERLRRWTQEIIEYARRWNERRDRLARGESVSAAEPALPAAIPSVKPWSNERIEVECQRIIENPTRPDVLRAFAGFVQAECHLLVRFGGLTGFILQHANNYAPGGPVHDAARGPLRQCGTPLLIHRWSKEAIWTPKPAMLRTLEGHDEWTTSVAVTSDGRRAVSGSKDGTLRVWDLESGRCERVLEGHGKPVETVSVTPDGRRAVSGSWDDIRVWDLESGWCERILEGANGLLKSLHVTPDGRRAVSGGSGNTIQVWDLERGACLRTLEGHIDAVGINSVTVTPDGRRAISAASLDKTMRIWDLESGVCLRTLEEQSSVRCVSVTPDGRRAVLGSEGNTLRVWDLESGSCLHTLKGHRCAVTSVSITSDGRRAVSGSEDDTLRLWDLESGDCLRTLEGHNSQVTSVSITPDGRRAVSASQDATLRVWDLESGCQRRFDGHGDFVWSVSLTPDGRRAVSGSRDRTLRVWDVESAAYLRTLAGHSHSVETVVTTPDGRRAVSGSMDKTLRVWDLEAGVCLHTLRGHHDDVTLVCIAPNGLIAVSGSQEDMTLRVWDLRDGMCLGGWRLDDYVWDISLTPDGRRLVSASGNNLQVLDMENIAHLRTLQGHSDQVRNVTVTADGQRAVSASVDTTLRVWDLESGACLRTLKGHSDWIWCVSVTPDGRHAVSASRDKTLRVWDLESGTCLRTLEGHRGAVYGVSVNPDGRCAVSRSGDTVRLWDLESGRCVAVFAPTAPVNSLAAAATLLAMGTQAGQVLLVEMRNLPPGPVTPPDNSDAAHEAYLRRGLDLSHREKGHDHEETRAHVAALAVQLERMSKTDKAR